MPQTRKQALELKVPPGVLVLITAILMWLVGGLMPTFGFQLPFQPIVAWFFVLFGIVIAGFGVFEFRRARTTVKPLKPGSSSTLVTRGVYQRTRNPMYLRFLLLLVGVATAMANLFAFLFLPAFMLYMNEFQIKPEERALTANFGTEFEKYSSGVRRWIDPPVSPSHQQLQGMLLRRGSPARRTRREKRRPFSYGGLHASFHL